MKVLTLIENIVWLMKIRIPSKLFVHSKANAERCDDCEIVVVKEEK